MSGKLHPFRVKVAEETDTSASTKCDACGSYFTTLFLVLFQRPGVDVWLCRDCSQKLAAKLP